MERWKKRRAGRALVYSQVISPEVLATLPKSNRTYLDETLLQYIKNDIRILFGRIFRRAQ